MSAPRPSAPGRPRWDAVAALLALAALVRVATLFYHEISGDDATVALMAKHVLTGENFPAFFYRQTHMGSLNGFHLVPALWLFGPSPLLVRLNAVAYSLLFPLGLYLLARRLFDETTARLVLLLAAVPPFLLTYWSSVAEPHFETNLFGVVLLLLALRALGHEPGPRQSRVLLVFGLTAGLAWWTNYKALEVIVPAVLALWLHDVRLPLRPGGALLTGGFTLGSLPVWLYHAAHRDLPGPAGSGVLGVTLPVSLPRLADLLLIIPPALLGTYYWPPETPARRVALAVNVAVYAAGAAIVAREAVSARRRGRAPGAREVALWLLLLLLGVPFAMVYLSTHVRDFDRETARYVLPAYVPLLLGVGVLIARLSRRSRLAAGAALAFLLAFNLWTHLRFVWLLQPGERATRQAHVANREAIVRHLAMRPPGALYVDGDVDSIRWAFLLSGIAVSEPTTELYAPGAVAADAVDRVAILATRDTETLVRQLDALGSSYRTTVFGRAALFEALWIEPRAYRLVPRAEWRIPGVVGPPPLADGDLGTAWPPAAAAAPDEVVVDLGAAYRLGRLVWWPPTDVEHTVSVSVAASADRVAWRVLGVQPSPTRRPGFVAAGRPFFRPRNGWLEVRATPEPSRYLRFTSADADTPRGWAIAELHVYEPAPGPGPVPPDAATVARALEQRGLRRLLADPGVSARVARMIPAIGTLTANGVLDSHGHAPAAYLARPVRVRPSDGLLVPVEDADELRRQFAEQGISHAAEPVAGQVLFSRVEIVPPVRCHRVKWNLESAAGRREAGTFRLEARLPRAERVEGIELWHPGIPVREVSVPAVAVSQDGETWRPLSGVRRRSEWAWGGRTLLPTNGEMERLVFSPTAARHLRIDLQLPPLANPRPRPVASVCVRGQPL